MTIPQLTPIHRLEFSRMSDSAKSTLRGLVCNPLAIIKGSAELAIEREYAKKAGDSILLHKLGLISREVDRMVVELDELLSGAEAVEE